MWIHEQPEWPNFCWDTEQLISHLGDVRHRQGLLAGKLLSLGFEYKQEAHWQTRVQDVLKSWEIEGEKLNLEEVRSSVAQKLGIEVEGSPPRNREVDGYVEMVMDATQGFRTPLTKDRLFGWHSAMFPSGRSGLQSIKIGGWRTPESGKMQVVSGAVGKEKIHFEAPCAERLDKEMGAFLEWFERKDGTEPVIRAGIAHLWFITLHPLEDGNGRIARVIADMALARAEGFPDRYYSVSSQMEAWRKDYYVQLETQQRRNLDITGWLVWFLKCLKESLVVAEGRLEHVLYKSWIWEQANRHSVNPRQRQTLSRMLEDGFEGHMNTSKYARMVKCSKDTALRDIKALLSYGILESNPGMGRSTSYRLSDRKKHY